MKTTYTNKEVEEAKEGWKTQKADEVKKTHNPGFDATHNTYIW